MKRAGRAGLAALVAVVLLAHGWALQAISGSLSVGQRTLTPPTSPTISQVRLVEAPSQPALSKPAVAAAVPAASQAPSVRPRPPRATTAPASPQTAPADVQAVQPAQPTPPPSEPVQPEPPAAALPAANKPAPESPGDSTTPASQAPRPVMLPPDADLRYQVEGQTRGLRYRADGELRWRQTDGHYELSMRLSAFLVGSRSQSSMGLVDAAGLMPERFSDRTRSEKAAHFDRSAQRIRFSNNAPDAPLLPGAQDRLSVFIQLAGLMRANEIPGGSTLELPVAGVGGSEVWRFSVGETEPLVLPAGTLLARRLVREPADTHDSRVELWLAPELGYLPVRLRITQTSGDTADQQLSQRP